MVPGLKGSLWNQKWFFYGITLKNPFGFQMAPPCSCVHADFQKPVKEAA